MSLPTNYSPKEYESALYQKWMESGIGGAEINQKTSKTHTILMPPPNLTGNLHAGHAFQHFLMDTLSRLARQRGESNLWFPGVDHAGLQLEGVIDKLIKANEFESIIGSNLAEVNREDWAKHLKSNHPDLWLECAWSKVNLWRDNQKKQAAILGDTPDYSRSLFTLDKQNLDMVNYAFEKYWKDGLIYKGSYLVNWSVGLQTALSDIAGEIEYEKKVDPFITFEYRIFEKNGTNFLSLNKAILVGTVRPETVFGDYAVAVHPEVFQRDYKKLEDLLKNQSLFVQIPLSDRFIPVILADEVDPSFGSGALKITPAHDIVDYDIFNKYIGGDFEQAIGRDGKLTEICGRYAGMTVDQGRLEVIKDLVENSLVPKKAGNTTERGDAKKYSGIVFDDNINPEDYCVDWNYEHNVTVCERTKTVVEPLISDEFFISYHTKFEWTPASKGDNLTVRNTGRKTNLQELGIEAVKATNFWSDDYQERGVNFLENIKDWCISRDLIWGHKMPVWYNLDTNPERKFLSFAEVNGPIVPGEYIQLHNDQFALSVTKPNYPGNWVQEEKILDTWMSSCLWPLSSLKYPEFLQARETAKKVILIGGGEVFESKQEYQDWLASQESNFKFFNGSKSSSNKNWRSTLKGLLEDQNIQLIEPKMPNVIDAQFQDWKVVFEKLLPIITLSTVLIGYSLGSLFLTKYLAENKVAYDSLFLLSGGVETKDNSFKTPSDLSFINNLDTVVLHSQDDSVVPFENSVELLELIPIANRVQGMDGMDHFFGESQALVEYFSFYLKLGDYASKEATVNPKGDFETFYPTQELTTGKDIFYQWIVRMTTLSYYFTAQIPYSDLVITPTILDDKGRKMSKSLNNGMDPVAQINKYSSDALRMSMMGNMIPNRNMKMGGRLADELCEKYRNFGNKMWNVARFFEYQESKEVENKKLNTYNF